jgi:opacity protein-like surface antigen
MLLNGCAIHFRQVLGGSVLALLAWAVPGSVRGQELYVGATLVGANYQGELQDKQLTLDGMTPGLGLNALYAHNDWLSVSLELYRGLLSGSDAKPDSRNRNRGLQFVTQLFDLTAAARINLYNNYNVPFIPYVTGGVSLFHVDPYTTDGVRGRVYLFPLSTEGQGLRAYPEIPKHRNLNYAVMGGLGLEMRMTEQIRVDVEVGFRKTFTDYIDDVSGYYPDPNMLLAERGPIAVQYSYRGDEAGGSPVFPGGTLRGNPGTDDWYHIVQVRVRIPIRNWQLEYIYKNHILRKSGWPYNWHRRR